MAPAEGRSARSSPQASMGRLLVIRVECRPLRLTMISKSSSAPCLGKAFMPMSSMMSSSGLR